MSVFEQVAGIDDQTIAWLLGFIAHYETTWGRYPTVAEVHAALMEPQGCGDYAAPPTVKNARPPR